MLSPSPARRYAAPILSLALLIAACSDDKSPGPDTTPPAPVTDLRVGAFTESTAVLIWTAPGDNGDRGQAAQYDLRVSVGTVAVEWTGAEPADAVLPPPGAPGGTEWVPVRGLEAGQVYFLALRTADGAKNWSSFSNVVRVEPGDPAPPARVTDLQAVDPAPHAVTLLFTAPGDDSLSGWAQEYALRVSSAPITEATWEEAEAIPLIDPPQTARSQEHIRITVLDPGTTAHLAIRARDDAGRWSDVSNDLEVTLPADTVPPGTITNLELVETGIFTATLRWTAPGNDGDEAKVDGYEIRYAESRIEDEAAWTAASLAQATVSIVDPGVLQTAVLTGLPGPKTLWFAVRAVDGAGQRAGVSNGVSGIVRRVPRTWVIRVDGTGDAPTVQAGIDSSAHGDTVLVGPGTYYENINMRGKGIRLLGEQGPEATILDGSRGDNSVVTSNPAEYTSLTIEGFTITGGAGTPGTSRGGGGIYSEYTGLTLRNCTVRGNRLDCGPSCYTAGAGIYATSPSARPPVVIESCRIEDNYSSSNAGGLFLHGPCVVQDNRIVGNRTGKGDGAGLYLGPAGAAVLVRRNLFWGNTANDHGGGIYVGNVDTPASMVEVTENLIIGNTALGADSQGAPDGSGGGCWMYGHGCTFHHNTVAFNRAMRVNGDFAPTGGVHLFNPEPDVRVEYNLIYANEGGGVTAYGLGSGGEHWSATVARNLIFANGSQDTATGVFLPSERVDLVLHENVFADPQFCVIGADSRCELAYGSPALTQPFGVIGAVDHGSCDPPARTRPRITTWEATRTPHAP